MSRDELLQLSGAQCIAKVLTHHIEYGRVLLKSDIAGTLVYINMCRLDGPDITYVCPFFVFLEFMFEALSSKNEPLLKLVEYKLT